MIIQNIVFPDKICEIQEMYFRVQGDCTFHEKFLELKKNAALQTDTYMNILDIEYWKRYTYLEEVILEVCTCGKCRLNVWNEICGEQENRTLVFTRIVEAGRETINSIRIPLEIRKGSCYLEVVAEEETLFYGARYLAGKDSKYHDVQLAVNIVTYHREEQIKETLSHFANSLFGQKDSKMYKRLKVYVIDNGDSLDERGGSLFIHVFKNSNQGGSGGFARGLEEIRKDRDHFIPSHIIFMDDDVKVQMESFYRLYAFLSLLREEYKNLAVAGRMFRLDDRKIQYTSVEKWNHGEIMHVNGNLDMSRKKNVVAEEEKGEYGGWWFCTYPAEYALRNSPFPFFLHCDDVEYGLRFDGDTITLKGVQVWHETFEYRQRPEIIYYDIRNSLVVNAMQGDMSNMEQFVERWKDRLTKYHNNKNYSLKYLCTLAMHHFRTGTVFRKCGKIPYIHLWVSEKEVLAKFISPLFHRYEEYKLGQQYEKIKIRYEEKEGKKYGCKN